MSSDVKIPEWAMKMAREHLDSYLYGEMSPDEAIAHALLAAEQRGEEKKAAEIEALLKDPVAVRVNYLRGGIACQPLIDEGERRGLEKAAEVAEGLHLQETENHGDLHDGDVAAAIRSLGEKT